jgi:hypothetical protein
MRGLLVGGGWLLARKRWTPLHHFAFNLSRLFAQMDSSVAIRSAFQFQATGLLLSAFCQRLPTTRSGPAWIRTTDPCVISTVL